MVPLGRLLTGMRYGPLKFDKVKNLIHGQTSNFEIHCTFEEYLINLAMFLHQIMQLMCKNWR